MVYSIYKRWNEIWRNEEGKHTHPYAISGQSRSESPRSVQRKGRRRTPQRDSPRRKQSPPHDSPRHKDKHDKHRHSHTKHRHSHDKHKTSKDKHKHKDKHQDKELRGEEQRDRDKGEYSRDKGEYSRDKGDYGRDKGEYGRDKGEYSRDKGEYTHDKGQYKGGDKVEYSRQQNHQNKTEAFRGKLLDEKDPYFEQRRQIERVRRTDPEKAQEMEVELQKKIIMDNKDKELQEAKEKFLQSQKQLQEARREDHTVLTYCLPLKAKEKDIWNFFSKANVGKIRDIQIIKDLRSGKSKGVAYVQFYTSESVEKALTLTQRPFEFKGREFMGLRIQHSQAQRNRIGIAAKQMRLVKPVDPLEQENEKIKRQLKVYVGGLTGKLQEIQQTDLKKLFDPFGEIDYVDIHRDPQTGKCKGFAFIQYASPECAKSAVKAMHGLMVWGQQISVMTVNTAIRGDVSAGDDYVHSAGTNSRLIENLSNRAPTHSNLSRPPISTLETPYLLLTNTFKMDGTTPAFFDNLKKEVSKQAQEFGIVEKIFIEKNNQGNVWLKYSDTQSAVKAREALNGKFYNGQKIFGYYVNDNIYQQRVGN